MHAGWACPCCSRPQASALPREADGNTVWKRLEAAAADDGASWQRTMPRLAAELAPAAFSIASHHPSPLAPCFPACLQVAAAASASTSAVPRRR